MIISAQGTLCRAWCRSCLMFAASGNEPCLLQIMESRRWLQCCGLTRRVDREIAVDAMYARRSLQIDVALGCQVAHCIERGSSGRNDPLDMTH